MSRIRLLGVCHTYATERVLVCVAPARVGPGARTRLFVSQAEEDPDPGVLQRVVLRVSDLESAVAELPDGLAVEREEPELAVFQGPQRLELGYVADKHVRLRAGIGRPARTSSWITSACSSSRSRR